MSKSITIDPETRDILKGIVETYGSSMFVNPRDWENLYTQRPIDRIVDSILREKAERFEICADPQWGAFMAVIDAADSDEAAWDARLVLADWLDERGHAWATGMRWMVANRRRPWDNWEGKWTWCRHFASTYMDEGLVLSCLPPDVYDALGKTGSTPAFKYTSRADADIALCEALIAKEWQDRA